MLCWQSFFCDFDSLFGSIVAPGREIERVYVDKGYFGHDAPKPMRVFRSGKKRGVHGQIRKELQRRSAFEPGSGLCKEDEHLGRNYLKGCSGDQINAVMSAVG